MACLPPKQLYDCSRRDSTNTEAFSVTPDTVSEVTSNGLTDGQTIPILVKNETGEFVPYLVNGEQVVLSEDNPSVLIEEEGMYKLDTSGIECPPDGSITVEAKPYASDVSTSVTGCYTDAEGVSVPVEIIRYSDGTTPVIYNLGTGDRIANPVGEFSQNCCDCDSGDEGGVTATSQILCDPDGAQVVAVITVDSATGIPTTAYFNLDGTVNEGDTSLLTVCEGASLESDPKAMCDDGATNFIRWFVLENGEPTGATFDTDLTGQLYTVTGAVSIGLCSGNVNDVETQRLCLIDNTSGDILQYVMQEIVYDSTGERIGTRIVDAVTGDPVAMPGGTHIGICEEPEDCPTSFATECYELPYKRQAYDNGFGTGPCPAAPISGPDQGGGGPSFGCAGTYQLISWIIDGVEQIADPIQFSGQVCGPDDGGQLGLHEQWANVLASIDTGTDWRALQSVECANYVAYDVPPGDQERQYGQMVIQNALAPAQVWTIDGAADEDTLRYTRVFQKDCDGNITSIWLDDDGNEIDRPEGELQSCCGSNVTFPTPDPVLPTPVHTGVRRANGATNLGQEYIELQSVTITALSDDVEVLMTNTQLTAIPNGMSLTWSVIKDEDSSLTAASFSGTDYILNWTYKEVVGPI